MQLRIYTSGIGEILLLFSNSLKASLTWDFLQLQLALPQGLRIGWVSVPACWYNHQVSLYKFKRY